MKDKFIRKFMGLAKYIAEHQNPCYSRKVGAVIVDPATNSVRGLGYNGPPRKTLHTDTVEFLSCFFWPMLTDSEKQFVSVRWFQGRLVTAQMFANRFGGRNICPRKLVNAKPGTRGELCSCCHAEVNAIINAERSVRGFSMFAWCGIPCISCCGSIIQSGISEVHCLKSPEYHVSSEWLLKSADIKIFRYSPSIAEHCKVKHSES